MGLKKFSIEFDRPVAVYFPGEVITGHVLVEVDSPKQTTGVWIQLKGSGYVAWTTRERNRRMGSHTYQNHHHHSASEHYFTLECCLIHDSGAKLTIPAGEHRYPYSFQLPQVLPSSFEGIYGYVRYIAGAKIVRSWRFDHDVKVGFTINSIVDLNINPQALLVPSCENSKVFGCMCCKSGPLSIKFSLNKGGFVPGETILISGVVNNHSRKHLSRVVAKLHQCIQYQTHTGTNREVRTVSETGRSEDVRPGQEQVWSNWPLPVPAIPPTNLGRGCSIICVFYELEIDATPSGFAIDLKSKMPILIGNIPIQDSVPPFQEPSAPTHPVSMHPNLPPLHYTKCMFGARNIREEGDSEYLGGDKEYTPMYPTLAMV